MAKPKNKSRTPEEALRGEIRGLRAEVKRLKQQLKYQERQNHFLEEATFQDLPEQPIIHEETCPECFKGKIKEVIVVGRYWKECSECTYRTKTRKI